MLHRDIKAHLCGVMLRDTAGAIRSRSTRSVVTRGLASGDPGYLSRARSAADGLFVDAVSAVTPADNRDRAFFG